MRILFLTTAHNSLSQRLWLELRGGGHEISIELAIEDAAMIEAVEMFRPDVIVAPFLKKAIPETIWRKTKCLIVHPGIKGDRGPSSLDWAIVEGERTWGVTVLEAIAEMDAGDIWSSRTFEITNAETSKSALYRAQVTEAAVAAVLEAIARLEDASFVPEPLDYAKSDVRGRLRPTMKQEHRRIDWKLDTTKTIAAKIRAADSNPGVLDRILGAEYFLYGAHEEDLLRGAPGEVLAQRDGAICIGTVDGAIWVSHLKERKAGKGNHSLKLPAALALGARAANIPISPRVVDDEDSTRTFREIRYREARGVGYLYFDFYNGAMSTDQCERLRDAYRLARSRPTKVIALMGGRDFWSNGIHLNTIEASDDPSDESWRNINAIDDLILEILTDEDHLVVSAVRGNAGAGGAMLALAADRVFARSGVVFNPHYKSMGLFGSEYWTYTLPRRVGATRALELTEECLPLGAANAREIGFVDGVIEGDVDAFTTQVIADVEALAKHPELDAMLDAKRASLRAAERMKPLASYRDEELSRMRENFYGVDSTYHDARRRFVYKTPPTRTCTRVALHRRPSVPVTAGSDWTFAGPHVNHEMAAMLTVD